MSLKKLFGKNLKRIRESKGLTQQELAELCEMQTNSIGLIEIGDRAASFATIEILADKLSVDYSDLFDFHYDVEPTQEKLIAELNRKISKFDKKLLKHMISYVELLGNNFYK